MLRNQPTPQQGRDDRLRPVVLITGAAGNLGRSVAEALAGRYQVVGLDRTSGDGSFPMVEADLTSGQSIERALADVRNRWGGRLASVVHLAAYFDFSGVDDPLYEELNVEGTRRLIRALGAFEVEQLVYASTMLVHAPGRPGETMDESWPIDPRWAYPRSKAAAEQVVQSESGDIPFVLLRLAGVYDDETAVPTLAQQISRIYERDFQSHLYSGDLEAGQSMLHRDDMQQAIRHTVDRRAQLPPACALLIGEPEAIGYEALQDRIGTLVHGEEDWPTLRVPKPVAAVGAWAQHRVEPFVPDAIDPGEEPFIRPFMVRMADDHYALDISRARGLLGWEPRHRLNDVLPKLIDGLKRDPAAWYGANGITAPDWLTDAAQLGLDPAALKAAHEQQQKAEHAAFRWMHFLNIGLGTWLLVQPPLIGLTNPWLVAAESGLGAMLILFATLSLSWRMQWARWICAGIGMLVMAVPFLVWTGNAAAYLSDTLVGMLVFGLALAGRPEPGVSAIAAGPGPDIPTGWSYNPSTWAQRLPIIALALIGLYVSRWLAAYQLDQIPGVWEPFFAGDPVDPQNGTEEIITSSVSEAFPVPDAALGGFVYALEIVTGLIGSRARWRTMPWLVILFGILIVPLGIVSISFIIIQPILIGTWSTLTLIAAAAMLVQIPYALDELVASLQFIQRRARAGQDWLRVLLVGSTEPDGCGRKDQSGDEFDAPPAAVLRDMLGGGVNLPWTLALCVPIGVWLMLTRLTLGAEGWMAHADHIIGSLVLTTVAVAAAEVARTARIFLIPLGLMLFVTPFAFGAGPGSTLSSLVCGLLLIGLSLRRGKIGNSYGSWDRLIR